MSQNPWKTLSSREIYKNPWIRLREDQVLRPDGNPGIYSVVEARIATGVLAINEKSEIVLVGQYRYPTNQYSWEIPEGGAEADEFPIEAIKRELVEEAGVEAENWRILGENIQLSNCYTNELVYLYLASNLKIVASNPDETEELKVKWVSLQQAYEMLDTGELNDSLTVMALLLYQRKFLSGKK